MDGISWLIEEDQHLPTLGILTCPLFPRVILVPRAFLDPLVRMESG